MPPQQNIRVLFLQPDPKACRSVKLYLQGLAGDQLDVQGASTVDDLQNLSRQTWDVMLVDSSNTQNGHGELLTAARRILGRVPEVNVGGGSGSLMTTCAETTIDDFFSKIVVNPAAVLRSVSNLLERRRLEAGLEEKETSLAAASHLDDKTGLWSEMYMLDRLIQEFRNCRRYQIELSASLIEICDYEAFSSTFGNDAVDNALCAIAEIIRASCRTTDFTGRWKDGGFAICWTNTPITGALIALDRIKSAIESRVFTGISSNFTVKACYGVAQMGPEHETFEDFFSSLRHALKAAQATAPGHIEIADPLSI